MALFSLRSFPIQLLQSNKHSAVSISMVSKTLNPRPIVPRVFELSISSDHCCPSLHNIRCCTSSGSSTQYDKFAPTGVFFKGLSQSTSEASLKAAFAHFGEVNRVKLISDRKTGQSLGYACVWFNSEESAQLAVEEMNGKFWNGRFVFVTIAKPDSSQRRSRTSPYKF